jgi:hypothetical protein
MTEDLGIRNGECGIRKIKDQSRNSLRVTQNPACHTKVLEAKAGTFEPRTQNPGIEDH